MSVDEDFLCGATGFGGGCAVAAPGVPDPLGWAAASAGEGVALRDESLVENMRVRRSFTDPFSAGFCSCSTEPAGRSSPFWPTRFGDREARSTDVPDLTDDGCDERCEMLVLVSGVVAMFRAGDDRIVNVGLRNLAGGRGGCAGQAVDREVVVAGLLVTGQAMQASLEGQSLRLCKATAIVAASAPSQRPVVLCAGQNSKLADVVDFDVVLSGRG